MSLEQTLERIATALEVIAAGTGLATPAEPARKPRAAKPAPAEAAAPAAAEAEAAAPTTADVQKLVVAAITANVRNGAVNILKAAGAAKASEVKTAAIPKVIANLQALLDEAALAE